MLVIYRKSTLNDKSALLALKVAYSLSFLWISRPVEFPIALFAIVPLILAQRKWFGQNVSLRYYVVALLLLFAFLVGHVFNGSLDGAGLIWQFLRVCYPFFLVTLSINLMRSLSLRRRNEFVRYTITFGASLLFLEAILRVIVYPKLAILALIGNVSAAYDFKSLSFFYIDANISAFIALYLFLFRLTLLLSKRSNSQGKKIDWWVDWAFIFTILVSFSRQAWYGTLIGLVVFSILYVHRRSYYAARVGSSVFLLFFCVVTTAGYVVLQAIRHVEYSDFGEFSVGSASTKLDIAFYTWNFITKSDWLTILFGLGPQKVITGYVVTHTGHSLLGLFPEFGIFLLPLIYFWFSSSVGLLIFYPVLMGAAVSLYPFAYMLPVLMAHEGVAKLDRKDFV